MVLFNVAKPLPECVYLYRQKQRVEASLPNHIRIAYREKTPILLMHISERCYDVRQPNSTRATF